MKIQAMKKMMFMKAAAFAASAMLFVTACSKNNDDPNEAKAQVNFRLTDGPADYDAIYLDIKNVEVTMENSAAVTLTPVHAGMYDILKFRNGLDTLLVRTDLPAGKINQMRLLLGPNSTIVVDGNTYPLGTPSGETSGIKLNLNESFVAGGAYNVWIDFDAAKSIIQTGNGDYKLKPVVRAYAAQTDGRIKGYVLPLAAGTTVYATNGTDVYSAIPNATDGYYRFSGLPAGNYTLTFDSNTSLYQDLTVQNIQVTYGTETNLGVTTLVP
jgi:hypothetical protein